MVCMWVVGLMRFDISTSPILFPFLCHFCSSFLGLLSSRDQNFPATLYAAACAYIFFCSFFYFSDFIVRLWLHTCMMRKVCSNERCQDTQLMVLRCWQSDDWSLGNFACSLLVYWLEWWHVERDSNIWLIDGVSGWDWSNSARFPKLVCTAHCSKIQSVVRPKLVWCESLQHSVCSSQISLASSYSEDWDASANQTVPCMRYWNKCLEQKCDCFSLVVKAEVW